MHQKKQLKLLRLEATGLFSDSTWPTTTWLDIYIYIYIQYVFHLFCPCSLSARLSVLCRSNKQDIFHSLTASWVSMRGREIDFDLSITFMLSQILGSFFTLTFSNCAFFFTGDSVMTWARYSQSHEQTCALLNLFLSRVIARFSITRWIIFSLLKKKNLCALIAVGHLHMIERGDSRVCNVLRLDR